MTGGNRSAPLSAPLRGVFSIPGSQVDFELINLVPLGVGSLAIRYLKKLLQALTGRNRLRSIHGWIISSFNKCGPARIAAPKAEADIRTCCGRGRSCSGSQAVTDLTR